MMEVVMTTGAIRLQSSTEIVTTNQHPGFYRRDALSVAQPTVSEHWKRKRENELALHRTEMRMIRQGCLV